MDYLAVPIAVSVTPDWIFSMERGQRFKKFTVRWPTCPARRHC